MKTIYTFGLKPFRYLYLGLLIIGVVSCSSFKNSSYENNDGIYSSSTRETTLNNNETYTRVKSKNVYAEKFKQMQSNLEETEYFTDVDSYSSNQVDTIYVQENSYAGWENNSNGVTVNYYNNGWNNWGYGYNSWYGPGWNNGFNYGWNNWYSPYYGYGWNNWGYDYSNYYGGFNNNVVHNKGRRGMNGYYPVSSGRTATVLGRGNQIRNSTVTPRTRTVIRNSNSTNSPRTVTSPRTTTYPRSSSPRTTTSPRAINTPRTLPSNSSSPRSSGSRGSSGSGGRSSGSGRGGRG